MPFTTGEMPGEYIELSWAAMPAPERNVSAEFDGEVAGVLIPRLELAGPVLANLLNDPSWRYGVQRQFEYYKSINYPEDVAAAMAKERAAEVALAFADALIVVANE